MSNRTCAGAMLRCSMGTCPSSLNVLPVNQNNTGTPAATIMDNIPMVNVMPFGMCTSAANPEVAAAMGSPMPCIPIIPAPWMPGKPTQLINGKPALPQSSKLMCAYGGCISIEQAGEENVDINT